MPLTDDQRAMLRLLAQRGEEGYEDIAALMGITVDEVRERVKEALVEVAEPETAPQPPEPAAAPPPPVPEPPQPAAEQPPAPQPVVPEPAAPVAEQSPPSAPAGKRAPAKLPSLKLPKDRGALIGLGAGALVVVAFAIVLIVSGGGSSSSDSSASTEAGQGTTTPAASESSNLTEAILSPVDGSDSSGTALFGRFKKNVLLQVTAEGLDPSRSGQSYAIWLSHSGKAMVPVGTAKVPASGKLGARFQIPTAVLVLVARGAFNEIDLTRTSDATLNAAIAKARQSKSESTYTGIDVMHGKITGPFVNAGK